MASIVGTRLASAEAGWKRIMNNDKAFSYVNFNSTGDGNFSSGVDYYITALNTGNGAITQATLDSNGHPNRAGEIKINFTGTKLRILGLQTNTGEEAKIFNCSVYIDGVYYGQLYDALNTTWIYRTVLFEKLDLKDSNHLLQIIAEPSSYRFWFDSIDIDENAMVTAPADKSHEFDDWIQSNKNYEKVAKVKEGDILTCKYTYASPLVLGDFSDFKLTKEPQEFSVTTPNATTYNISDKMEIYGDIKHKELYDLSNGFIKFNYFATFNTTEQDGYTLSDQIDLHKDFKAVIDFDEHHLSAVVVPNNLILKTKELVEMKSFGDFSGFSVKTLSDDIETKYLLSIDNNNFYYFDTASNNWKLSNVNDIDTNGMSEFTEEMVKNEKFKSFISGKTKIGFVMSLGIKVPDDIDLFDYTKERKASTLSIHQDKVSDSISSGTATLNFYYTYADGDKSKNRKHFIADNVVQYGIPWNTLSTTIGYEELDKTFSDYYPQIYISIPSSKPDKDEYKDYVLTDDSKYHFKEKYSWVNNGTKDTSIAREDEDSHKTTAKNTDSDTSIGLRSQIVINTKQKVTHRYNTDCPLPVVKKMADLAPGKAIACTYVAPTANKPGEFTIGRNGRKIIPDYGTSTPNGYFYWICVGKAFSGALKLIADRNIQTGISWEALNAAGYCVTSGRSVKLGSVKNCIIRLPNTVSQEKSGRENCGEWDECISYYSQNGINASANTVWNAATLKSWTLVTPQGAMGNRIVRGAQDEDTVADEYTQENVGSNTVDRFIGFRPVAEVPTAAMQTQIDHPDCKLKIAKSLGLCKVGEAVACEYRCDKANTIGTFNFNPSGKLDVITDPAPDTPNGVFYWICVGKAFSGAKKFIADRNLQTSISWETINAQGMCVTSGKDISDLTGIDGCILRLIHSDVTNYDMPLDSSEWDEILMADTVGNTKQTVDKIHDWNMRKTFSWMLDTPHADGFTPLAHTMGDRVIRGKEKNDYSLEPKLFTSSGTVSDQIGFRPVLEVPLRFQSCTNNTIVDTTHVNEKNPYNQFVHVTGAFALFDENQTYKNCDIKFLVNDKDTEIKYELDDTLTYDIEVPLELFKPGDNVLKVLITTKSEGEDPIENKFTFGVELEDKTKLSKVRNYSVYTGGFELNTLNISGKKVVNNNKVRLDNTPAKVEIPKNTIEIKFEEV